MRKFSVPVDLRSRQEMESFLRDHFRYPTMNSWNQATSYACNLKVHSLGLASEITSKLYDMLDTQEFFDFRNDLLAEFNRAHGYRWQAGFNGRSGGYLVLYQGELRSTGHLSYCTHCGQRNYRSIADTGNVCGACGRSARVDYSTPPKQPVTFPGRGTDMDEDYDEWSLSDLRSRVKLVQELDSLADAIVSQAIHLANAYEVVEEEYFVPQTRHVLVAKSPS